MISRKVSRRYAIGLLNVVRGESYLDDLVGEVNAFSQLYSESNDLRIFFKSPVIDKEKKKNIIDLLFKSKSKIFINFIKLIINHGRETAPSPIPETVIIDDYRFQG